MPVCSPVASFYDARAKDVLAGHCEVLHLDAELVEQLDDKHAFSGAAPLPWAFACPSRTGSPTRRR